MSLRTSSTDVPRMPIGVLHASRPQTTCIVTICGEEYELSVEVGSRKNIALGRDDWQRLKGVYSQFINSFGNRPSFKAAENICVDFNNRYQVEKLCFQQGHTRPEIRVEQLPTIAGDESDPVPARADERSRSTAERIDHSSAIRESRAALEHTFGDIVNSRLSSSFSPSDSMRGSGSSGGGRREMDDVHGTDSHDRAHGLHATLPAHRSLDRSASEPIPMHSSRSGSLDHGSARDLHAHSSIDPHTPTHASAHASHMAHEATDTGLPLDSPIGRTGLLTFPRSSSSSSSSFPPLRPSSDSFTEGSVGGSTRPAVDLALPDPTASESSVGVTYTVPPGSSMASSRPFTPPPHSMPRPHSPLSPPRSPTARAVDSSSSSASLSSSASGSSALDSRSRSEVSPPVSPRRRASREERPTYPYSGVGAFLRAHKRAITELPEHPYPDTRFQIVFNVLKAISKHSNMDGTEDGRHRYGEWWRALGSISDFSDQKEVERALIHANPPREKNIRENIVKLLASYLSETNRTDAIQEDLFDQLRDVEHSIRDDAIPTASTAARPRHDTITARRVPPPVGTEVARAGHDTLTARRVAPPT